MITRRAPTSTAAMMSSPVPTVDAATGSLASAPPTSASPEAAAISMTAVRPSSRQARIDRRAERARDRGGAVGTAERLEGALAPVGHRDFVAVPPQLEGGVAYRLGDRGRRRGSPQLVGSRDHTHTDMRGLAGDLRAARYGGLSHGAPSPEQPIVLVSNRGPVSFERTGAGELISKRGAGGLVSGIGPLAADGDVTWLAAAMSDEDREAASAGVVEADGFRVRLLDLDEETFRLAYDVVSNEVLWFAHHGLWDLPREPAFDASWNDAWDAYRAVNHAFADAVAEAAPAGATVLVQDYHLCLVAARLRATRPDVTSVHFHHTPFAPPVWLSALPEAAARELLEGLAAHRACGFHSQRWANDFRSSSRRWPMSNRPRSSRRWPRTRPTSVPRPPLRSAPPRSLRSRRWCRTAW